MDKKMLLAKVYGGLVDVVAAEMEIGLEVCFCSSFWI
jgi:hypothetical protein